LICGEFKKIAYFQAVLECEDILIGISYDLIMTK